MAQLPATSTGIRERTLRSVLAALYDARPLSRADLAVRTGLSKPTVAGALRAFSEAGLVREFGRITGRRGPSASLYEPVPAAVRVLGVDIGARYVRALVADLDGTTLDDMRLRLARPHAEDVLAGMREIRRRLGDGPLEAAVVGTPGVVDPGTGRIGAAPNLEGWEGVMAERVLGDALGARVRVDNDVNLAALGEQAEGAGRGVDSFAYLTIGSGLGAGIVLHGHLHRGARGAAGEVGFLPLGGDPFADFAEGGGAAERRLSTHGLLAAAERLAHETDTACLPPFDVQELFEAARRGDRLGRALANHTARELALCVAGLTSVLDLDLVLIGGGIGANDDLLLPDARTALARLVPAPPRMERAALGERAVRTGAAAVALADARDAIVARLSRGHDVAPDSERLNSTPGVSATRPQTVSVQDPRASPR